VHLEGHQCFIQRESKNRKKSYEEEDVSVFFDTECCQPEPETVEESMSDLLFFDFDCRQENRNHEANLCIVQSEAGEKWISRVITLGMNFANGCLQ
jgi:hypothetical protein